MALTCDICGESMRGDEGEDTYLLEDIHILLFKEKLTDSISGEDIDCCESCYDKLLSRIISLYITWSKEKKELK